MSSGWNCSDKVLKYRQELSTALAIPLFFLAVCLCAASAVKRTAVLLILLTLAAVFFRYSRLRSRVTPPVLALALVVLLDGLTNIYAVSGKFALYEFLKVLCAFCLALLLLALTGERRPQRQTAVILEGCAAIAGLVSIDLLATRWLSTPILRLLGMFSPDYLNLNGVEDGIRMTSLFMNPNIFAGVAGIGLLLSLGLTISSETPRERTVHLVCLEINALSFVLAFSMGACLTIFPAFLALLLLTKKEDRPGLFLLMAETLAVTLLTAFPISRTSMTAWTGTRLVPLACLTGGVVLLWAMDRFLGRHAAAKLKGRTRAVLVLAAAGLVVFAAAAYTLTGGITLRAGESLRRGVYPAPGYYALTADADEDLTVVIESQNRADAMMHTSTRLYEGPLSLAVFTVPDDSLVVYFEFSAGTETRLESLRYEGENGSGLVPLDYRLLPGFVANRLQGLRANQNAIQRLVFFQDGVKLFRRSPLLGLGLGGFENAAKSVQSFFYETKYVHNHYIQALVDTGAVGLALFLGLLALSFAAVWQSRRTAPLAPALGAALVFMAAHGGVEVVFSSYPYLPIAFGVFAASGLTLGEAAPRRDGVRGSVLISICALLTLFGVLLNGNLIAQGMRGPAASLEDLERSIRLDCFEWTDPMLAYVMDASGLEAEDRQKADAYAARLGEVSSNTIPFYLAEYYLKTGRIEEGVEMAERYAAYMASDAEAWRKTFQLLERYESNDPAFREGAARIAEMRETWNAENLGFIPLDEETEAFIARVCAGTGETVV